MTLLSLADFPGLPDIPEEGATFAENAAAKAKAVARLTGHAALADDSGLMVDALRGAPGVFSARYAQDRTAPRPPTDADNWGKLLDELQGVPWGDRGAHFVCELALATARRQSSDGPGRVRRRHRAWSPRARRASATTRSSGCRSMPPPWPNWGRRSKTGSATGPGRWRPSKRCSGPGCKRRKLAAVAVL